MHPLSPLRALGPGDRVSVVAPSSPFDRTLVDNGIAWLREHFTVDPDPSLYTHEGYLAGHDTLRARALINALEDRTVRAIFCARGGYGSTRLLEFAGERLLRALTENPKVIVGFSDITALHALTTRAEIPSLHGPMVVSAGRSVTADHRATIETLLGKTPAPWHGLSPWAWPARTEINQRVTGRLLGGNLTVLASLVGTPWFPDLDGAILMLEDVGEKPYRVDRTLTTLRLSGALSHLGAVVLGSFSQCEPNTDGVTVEDVLRERLCDLGVPVVAGAPFGHAERHAPWVQRSFATLTQESLVFHSSERTQ